MTGARPRDELAVAFNALTAFLSDDAAPGNAPIFAKGEWPGALEDLGNAFDLSAFEASLVLLLAGREIDAGVCDALARRAARDTAPDITVGAALSLLPQPHWSAFSPARPLRRWRLAETGAAPSLTAAAIRLDERILFHLLGVSTMDPRALAIVGAAAAPARVSASQARVAEAMRDAWRRADGAARPLSLLLHGGDARTRADIAAMFCDLVGLEPWRCDAAALPPDPSAHAEFAVLWEREAVLEGRALIIDDDDAPPEAAAALRSFCARCEAPLIRISAERGARPTGARAFELRPPTTEERIAAWREGLTCDADAAAALACCFRLELREIAAIADEAATGTAAAEVETAETATAEAARDGRIDHAWRACRDRAAPRAAPGVEIIRPATARPPLELPPEQAAIVGQIKAQASLRWKVLGEWGFGDAGPAGRGAAALFSGPSGTGKTFAAEAIAADLRLDLHRIEISGVMNKYIGETEKTLDRIFATAEASGAVLLFDEADALFGRRGEVKDSHDRYANIGVSYLLQRIEAYQGLAILTTNLKANIDEAFMRRFRHVVDFTLPDQPVRERLWRAAFPPATPTEGLDAGKLSVVAFSGAEIRNIALGAAYQAAARNEPVRAAHVVSTAAAELAKTGRKLSAADARRLS